MPSERSYSVTVVVRLAFSVMTGIWSSASVSQYGVVFLRRLIIIFISPQLSIRNMLASDLHFRYLGYETQRSNEELMVLLQMSNQLINNGA